MSADPVAGEQRRDRMRAVPETLPGASTPVIPSADGKAAITTVSLSTDLSGFALADAVKALRTAAADGLPPQLTSHVTGGPAFGADIANAFSGANVTLLVVTAQVVALLLIATYRSPILWLVPLTVIGLADRVATRSGQRWIAGIRLLVLASSSRCLVGDCLASDDARGGRATDFGANATNAAGLAKPGKGAKRCPMNVRRLILVLGAVALIAGVVDLLTPVSVSGSNGDTIGCGTVVASDLSAARDADNKSVAKVPILNQTVPHSNYVAQCQSSLSHRRAWSIPLAVAGAIAIAGALVVRGRPAKGGLAPPAP